MILFFVCLCFAFLTSVLLFNVRPARLSDSPTSSIETALSDGENCLELANETSED